MKTKRQLKRRIDRLRRPGAAAPVAAPARTSPTGPRFEAGQHVRVRPREEIEATLDSWGQLRGCGFMPEMAPYCGTTQRVLKPVRQFVDERDYKLKKARGVYLLEGLLCEGTELFGRCDRGCLYFWREEWLEPASDGSG